MRKLIEIDINKDAAIQCDNPECDFIIPTSMIDGYDRYNPIESIRPFINISCPKCGQNILTEHDFTLAENFYKIINWFNKYFSWLTIFFKPKNTVEKKVSFHNEIKIE